MTKAKAEKTHFRRRCLERLGRAYDHGELKSQLQHGNLEFIKKQSNRVTLWRKDNAVFVYDKSRKAFVTALTYDMWKDGKVLA